jgi:hypothetical protein
LQCVEHAPNCACIRWCVVSINDVPIAVFARENGFGFAWRVDRNPIKNVGVDPNEMIVPQVRRLRVKDLFELFRQRIDRSARSEPHVHLVFFFFGYCADLQRLPFVFPSGNFDGLADLDFLIFFLLLIK